jgi:hypothetical protein
MFLKCFHNLVFVFLQLSNGQVFYKCFGNSFRKVFENVFRNVFGNVFANVFFVHLEL